MKISAKYGLVLVLLMSAAVGLFSFACNSTSTGNNGGAAVTLTATTIADANHDSTKVVADIRRQGTKVTTAVVRFSADTLKFRRAGFPIDSVYSLLKLNDLYYGVGKYKLTIADGDYSDSASIRLADSATITNVVPTNRIAQGLRTVTVEWTGADSTDGYIIATAPKDSIYHGYGYSMYSTSLQTAGTIPPDAFSLSPGPSADTGWYYLYVYAFTGTPDSVLTRKLLPVPLPSQLSDNISGATLSGRIGTVVVIRHDSVHVVAGTP
jgi:hypothetical protein